MTATTKFELKLGAATREAFGKTLALIARTNPDIVVCDADLSKSTNTHFFAKEFPDRFFFCGIAESNMVALGAGLAYAGKIQFVSSFAAFVMNKGFGQLRVPVAGGCRGCSTGAAVVRKRRAQYPARPGNQAA